ncbi:MAG: hypothetical protein P0Y53_20280 [Candidatus Pseudobacter hemicellulosilyticus]|uniref:Lipoprotein n=1 Tax=Candidatus Pseudobacter hemicellulosilyticus TaxID=3121375 RepID=A0AAJ5WSE2_9BACT|nr:MAG: hypothetical protein P0Y53_20280 [Pseudobacter sp.]
MKPFAITLTVCCWLLFACKPAAPPAAAPGTDSLAISKDSLQETDENENEDLADFEKEEFEAGMQALLKSYDTPIQIDTSLVLDEDSVRLRLKYFCLKDSAIRIPKSFFERFLTKDFITHNFACSVHLENKGQVMLDTTITADYFRQYFDKDFRAFAVLSDPWLAVVPEEHLLKIEMVMIVPLTEIVIFIVIKVNKDGKIEVVVKE